MHTFDLVVVGSGGGPSETNISAYLLKERALSWEDGIVALEAGSGVGALQKILDKNPDMLGSSGEKHTAAQIYSFVRAYVITHTHLDHVLGLVLLAGAFVGQRRRLMGSMQTLKDLESIFRPSRIWPNLASWNENDADFLYLYDPLYHDEQYRDVNGNISVRMMPISHGSNPVPYESSAFFVRHKTSMKEFLFFGDVEPDSISSNPQTIKVWRSVAPMIPDRLNTIFIECSWPSGREDAELFGHLSPKHLADELENLAAEVVKTREISAGPSKSTSDSPARKKVKLAPKAPTQPLKGLRVYVMHFKEDMESVYDRPIHEVITEQVRDLVAEKKLGVEILCAEQGMRIQI
ncbi:cyclic-AMP phosphodiesterase [Rickenella mellea]|uniref:Cyclic-AMP phosphodiesterase n=1 Tax=Rickenella mellea TaxID=50990 RepID=A0A4Y7QHT8_9AGAM|nr:cyclic-AMP phosphodiesterase [Rickenella mellea]